jgi:hypothetical protein
MASILTNATEQILKDMSHRQENTSVGYHEHCAVFFSASFGPWQYR